MVTPALDPAAATLVLLPEVDALQEEAAWLLPARVLPAGVVVLLGLLLLLLLGACAGVPDEGPRPCR